MPTSRHAAWIATICLTGTLLAACGGSDEEPTIKPTSDAPSAAATRDAAGFTPEQREAADAVVGYFSAVLERGTAPIGPAIDGLVTSRVVDGLVPAETKNVEEAGLQYIGAARIEPKTVTIDGDTATVTGCNDSSKVFLVKKGQTAPGVGSRTLGISDMTVRLVRQDGAWLVDLPTLTEATTC